MEAKPNTLGLVKVCILPGMVSKYYEMVYLQDTGIHLRWNRVPAQRSSFKP